MTYRLKLIHLKQPLLFKVKNLFFFIPNLSMIKASSITRFSESEKERRAKMAALKREKIMAQMLAMQNNFMKENGFLFEEETSKIFLH